MLMIIKNMGSAPNITYTYFKHMFVMMQPEDATRAQILASNVHPTPPVGGEPWGRVRGRVRGEPFPETYPKQQHATTKTELYGER